MHSDLLQRILELTVDELNAAAEVAAARARSLQCALETVEDRQKVLDDIGRGKFAEFLLFTHPALPGIVEFRLLAGKTIQQRVALGLELFCFRWRAHLRRFRRHRVRGGFFY